MLPHARTSAAAIHGPAEADLDAGGHGEGDGEPAGARTTPSSPGSTTHGHASSSGSSPAVILGRLVSGVEWRQPLASDWSGSASLLWQRTSCLNEAGQPMARDCYGCPLTFSGSHQDVMALGSLGANYR
jgi:hypothetical protein